MKSISTYLIFNGNCEEAFNFYKSVFGGDFNYVGRFSEMPVAEGQPPISEAEKNKIMHISLSISDQTQLMGSDTMGESSSNYKKGNNFSMSIQADEMEEADQLFDALSTDGEITMGMNKTFWGSYFGMLTDKFGINWMLSVDLHDKT